MTIRRFRRGDHETVITELGIDGGPTYVLVHGVGMGHRTWSDLAETLARSGRVLALDLPGFGDAPEPEESLDMASSGAYLGELVATESPGEPVVLVGHSMGTQIVAETAAQRPELVAAVILIAPTINRRERTAGMQALRLVQDLAFSHLKVLALGVRYYVQAGPRWYFAKLADMLAHRIELVLPRIRARTLVVRGEHDQVAPRDWAELVTALLPDGRLVEVAGRGHETMITAGAEVARLVAAHAAGEPVGHPVAQPVPTGRRERPDTRPATTGDGVPWWRAARWWAADYLYAGWRHLAAPFDRRDARHWQRGDDSLPEVVLLPGIYEHWTFLRPLAERLHRAGHRVRVVHGLGANRRPISATAALLGRALSRRSAPPAGRVIVGHSKGGLVGKQLLVDELQRADATGSAPGAELGLLGVVAICTPFGGSSRARFFFADRSLLALLPGDATIHALGEAREVDARIVSVFGRWDPHIPDGSELPGARNIEVPVAGHFRVLGAPETARAVLDGIAGLAEQEGARVANAPEAAEATKAPAETAATAAAAPTPS
ncbi:alpha/beta fold hydrolase [Agromyces soli]|uniref:Alpha/beta hydrolase n=1 Tax=Agromyces soli TaxID=659012 RepID=A0ABY4AXW5_9MICO|nr:alpha/beta fold hydrolase [Agromyces soli]UOE26956.1 alpha/beta hydrolase [Agromyces soli]